MYIDILYIQIVRCGECVYLGEYCDSTHTAVFCYPFKDYYYTNYDGVKLYCYEECDRKTVVLRYLGDL